ncbi:MAG: hypothetical protein RIG84_17865 [Roseovarius sp.]
MMRGLFICAASLTLAGCATLPGNLFGDGKPDVVVRDGSGQVHPKPRPGSAPPAGARTADEFDITSAEERAAAVDAATPAAGERDLGLTIASLGAVTEPGIWLKTPLVDSPSKGRVEYPERGTGIALQLLPLDAEPGAGSRLSLAAMRLLEADLTSLPELRVFLKN